MPYKDLEKRKAYHAAYLERWNQDNKDKRREYTRKSMQKWRDANPELSAEKMRQWRQANRARSLESVENYKRENPEKAKAHRIVMMAKKSGKLIPSPCVFCGNPKSQAHHEDYSKPLEVTWVCQKHHSQIHSKL